MSFIAAPDFETPIDTNGDNVYDVTVQVSDDHGGSDTQALSVTVTNIGGISPPSSNAASIIGTGEEDVLTGRGGPNNIQGLGGNDLIAGAGGTDTLSGGDGNDTLTGGAGNDTVSGGAGNDTIAYVIGDGADAVDGGADFDRLDILGTAANNTLNVLFNGPYWKGYLKLALVSCPIALHGGTRVARCGVEDHRPARRSGGQRGDARAYRSRTAAPATTSSWSTTTTPSMAVPEPRISPLRASAPSPPASTSASSARASKTYRAIAATTGSTARASPTICSWPYSAATTPSCWAAAMTARSAVTAMTIVGDRGNDTLDGGSGNDTLDGGAGADRLLGGDGDDVFIVDNLDAVSAGNGYDSRIVHPAPTACPCCGSNKLSRIGEDVTETLDVVSPPRM